MGVKRETPGSTVLVRLEDGVLSVTLNRPERRNAVDDATADGLHEAVRAVRDDPACQVIVLTGAGPTFCAGWDVEAIASLRGRPQADVEASFARNRLLLEDLRTAPQVTVAAVHGAVMGFGLGLVANCDIVVAAESTLLALPEVGLGVVPALVMLDLLEAMPEKVALDWLLSGERRTAAHGLQAGLFSRVVTDHLLEPEVTALAQRLASNDPGVLRETKRLYRRFTSVDRETAVREAIASSAAALVRE